MADETALGNPPRITGGMWDFLTSKLSGEERTWNATQLAEALEEEFGLAVTPEAVRQHLHSMGYSWKRTRYVSNKAPNPQQEREARADLEGLKGGGKRRDLPELPR